MHGNPPARWRRREWCQTLLGVTVGASLGTLTGCTSTPPKQAISESDRSLLRHAEFILLGEQHDAPAHHALEALCTQWLIETQHLGALVLEMADAGHDTQGLPRDASEAQTQRALGWQDRAWPWADYAPAIMAAVRAGIPIYGGNLPAASMAAAMHDSTLSSRLPPAALQSLQTAVRDGHCGLLPESQIAPMARIQIAKDISMARTLERVHTPERATLLLCGRVHADRLQGVPLHLARTARVVSVHLRSADSPQADTGAFDLQWLTAATPPRDYCGELKAQWAQRRVAPHPAPKPRANPTQ